MKPTKQTNAAKVKAFRLKRGWTQEWMTQQIGCSLTAVQDAESGKTANPYIVLLGMLQIELRENAGTGASE